MHTLQEISHITDLDSISYLRGNTFNLYACCRFFVLGLNIEIIKEKEVLIFFYVLKHKNRISFFLILCNRLLQSIANWILT